uniref:Ribosomal protein S16 n=1 Tax=Neocheiropteris ovata TaxID=504320 RepID=A0A7T1C5J1_9MONI|nr:ribosomal protein S16 [Neocheiropteris ovata]QPM99493.1 ribosomal protein S16 [Neocheiropteris ovata]
MVKPRLKQHDKKQRLLIEQLQLIPNLGERRIDASRGLVSITLPLVAKSNWISTFLLLYLNKLLKSQRLFVIFRKGQGDFNKSELTYNLNLNF